MNGFRRRCSILATFITLASCAAVAPLAAQDFAPIRSAPAVVTPGPAPTPTAGPRLRAEWRSFEPRAVPDTASVASLSAVREHTIRVSTVVLVVAAVVLVLLIIA